MTTTKTETYTVVTDPKAAGYIFQGRAMCNVGLWLDWMVTDTTKDLKARCQAGIDDGSFEGTALAGGNLSFMGQTFDLATMRTAIGK